MGRRGVLANAPVMQSKPELLRLPSHVKESWQHRLAKPSSAPPVAGGDACREAVPKRGVTGDPDEGREKRIKSLIQRERELCKALEETRAQLAAEVGVKVVEHGTGATIGASFATFGGGGAGETHVESAWKLGEADRERLEEAFKEMDINNDGVVDDDERRTKRGHLTKVLTDLGLGPRSLDTERGELSFAQFQGKIERERELTLKEQSLVSAGLVRLVAESIPGGFPDWPLEGLQDMNSANLDKLCWSDVLPKVRQALARVQDGLKKIAKARMERGDSSTESNIKFAVTPISQAVFGKLEDFHKGIADKIGLPNARLMEGMEAEHCRRSDSEEPFTPGNYNTMTTSLDEWMVVTDDEKGKEASKASTNGRHVRPLGEVMKDEIVVRAKLRREEVVALML